jgi:hypothetical protein
MRITVLTASFAALWLTIAPIPAAAQQEERPSGGKIDAVERDADRASPCGCDDDDGFFVIEMVARMLDGLFHAPVGSRGYLDYPYAMGGRETFVLSRRERRREFGVIGLTHYQDPRSTLHATRVEVEGARGPWYAGIEYGLHVEPLARETDYLHTWRAGFGALPALGRWGYLKLGIAARGLTLDDGETALGPEVEIAARAFVLRPYALSASVHAAALTWHGDDAFALLETAAFGSVFIARVEVQAGWRWMRIGDAPAFSGPTLGMRVWF